MTAGRLANCFRRGVCNLALAGILSAGAHAAGDTAPTGPDRYAVELIVFEHLDQSRNTPEQPPLPAMDETAPDDRTPGEGDTPRKPSPMDEAAGPDVAVAEPVTRSDDTAPAAVDFQPLPADEFRLNDVLRRLQRLDAYRPILHIGWIQPGLPRAAAQPFRLAGQPGTGLSGEITLYRERFVHLAVELSLEQALDEDATRIALARLVESRRLRGTRPQYFDNPRFGVLAAVWKMAPEPAATADTPEETSSPAH